MRYVRHGTWNFRRVWRIKMTLDQVTSCNIPVSNPVVSRSEAQMCFALVNNSRFLNFARRDGTERRPASRYSGAYNELRPRCYRDIRRNYRTGGDTKAAGDKQNSGQRRARFQRRNQIHTVAHYRRAQLLVPDGRQRIWKK